MTKVERQIHTELLVNNVEKVKPLLAQMEQWSILSNTLNYIQYDDRPRNIRQIYRFRKVMSNRKKRKR